jgi:hypothetical protein
MSQLGQIIQRFSHSSKVPFAQQLFPVHRLWEQLHTHFPRPKRWIYLGWFGGVQIYQTGRRT